MVKKIIKIIVENVCDNCMYLEEDNWVEGNYDFFCRYPNRPVTLITKRGCTDYNKEIPIPDNCPLENVDEKINKKLT